MKKLIVVLFCCLFLSCFRSENEGRIVLNFDRDWQFMLNEEPDSRPMESVRTWKDVTLPHDFMIFSTPKKDNPSGVNGGFWQGGVGLYRKTFTIPQDYEGKKIFIQFDGIMFNSTLSINGHQIANQWYGYASHHYDISDFILFDKPNVINVRVDAEKQPNDRWYSGAGIFRHVWLHITDPIHIPMWGTSVHTHLSDDVARVHINSVVRNETDEPHTCRIRTSLINPDGERISIIETREVFPHHEKKQFTQEFIIKNPKLWSPDSPTMFSAMTEIVYKGSVADRTVTPFGIRSVEFLPDSGLVLNGKKIVMKGVCLHHDGGCMGAAVPEQVWQRRLKVLKDMGVNALRLAHNPHAPEILDMCDRMGFLVFDEMYDKWVHMIGGHDWPLEARWENTWKKDLTAFIQRDRNHPSVVLWSVGNETVVQLQESKLAIDYTKKLVAYVKSIDSTRMITVAMHPGNSKDGHEVPSRMIHHMDVVSYNYRTNDMPTWHRQFPDYVFISSETKAYKNNTPEDWRQVDFSDNSWFHLQNFSAGQFIWAGIDYLGESRGWPDKGIRSGLLYTNGFRKPYSWFTESIYSDNPMVHTTVLDDSLARALEAADTWMESWYGPPVADHWTFPEKVNDSTEVFTFSNCNEVELLLNGKSQGKKKTADFKDGVVRWYIPYVPGSLKTIGFIDGQVVAEHEMHTAGKAQSLAILADREQMAADGQDVLHLEIRVIDRNDVLVPRATFPVRLKVSGGAKLVGLDNGDMGDHTSFKGDYMQTRGGRLLAIIRSNGENRNVSIEAESAALQNAKLTLLVK